MMLRVALILAVIRAQTPPPVSGPAEPSPPPAEPTPPSACADDATWHKKDDEAKNCQWVSQLLPTRCDVHGDSQTAQEACRKTCDTCESELPPPRRSTFAPTVTPSEEEECRTDICLDRDNDCCAPLGTKPEPRGCSIPGFVVKPDPTGSSGLAPCKAYFGQDAIYKCCRDTEFANPNEVCRSDICKSSVDIYFNDFDRPCVAFV